MVSACVIACLFEKNPSPRRRRGQRVGDETCVCENYTARNAVATGRRAARIAGSSPPIKPIEQAQIIPTNASCGLTARSNTRLPCAVRSEEHTSELQSLRHL